MGGITKPSPNDNPIKIGTLAHFLQNIARHHKITTEDLQQKMLGVRLNHSCNRDDDSINRFSAEFSNFRNN